MPVSPSPLVSIYGTALLAVGSLLAGPANAAIVNIVATGTVASTDSAQFSVGEEVSWTIQYDDADPTAHIYTDGPNFIAEGGLGDDVLSFTATDDLTNDYADVVFDFGDIFTKLLDGEDSVPVGFTNFNQSIMENGVFSYQSDGFNFFGFSSTFRVYANVNSGTAKDLVFSSVTYAPAPSVPAIGPLGLAVLLGGLSSIGTLTRYSRA